jgi:MYXO-CTERM domain-containing protein
VPVLRRRTRTRRYRAAWRPCFGGANGLTGNVEFRLFAWGAVSVNGTFDIETINFAGGGTYGIRLNGEVVPVPGASSLALLGIGGLVAGRRRRA